MNEVMQGLTIFKDQINTLLGGLVAMAGFLLQHKLSQGSLRQKLLLEKVEAAYSLCQKGYDGHLREILLFEQIYQTDTATYFSKRKHPGQEISDLKMLVRCYFPTVEDALEEFDRSHKALKNKFSQLDQTTLDGKQHLNVDVKKTAIDLRMDLDNFGRACNVVKALLTDLAKKSTR